ncbi:hypothetical protein, partial [Desulfobacter curvatus]|uniref:hypothetical protein n=1 Tax=Desulfobacter curvatus TaxID=2290 RepID=UPI001FDF5183
NWVYALKIRLFRPILLIFKFIKFKMGTSEIQVKNEFCKNNPPWRRTLRDRFLSFGAIFRKQECEYPCGLRQSSGP